MAYHVGKGSLFLHVPKTGGKAVLRALEAAGNMVRPCRSPGFHVGHANESQLSEPRYKWNFRFGFVRNPVAWWKSLRDFANSPASKLFEIDPGVVHPFNEIIPLCRELKDATADDFLWAVAIEGFPGFYSAMLRDYFGERLDRVDFVGRWETLARDLFDLCEIRNLRKPEGVPVVNASAPLRPCFLSPSTVEGIESTEQWALSVFYGDRGTTGNVGGLP